MRARPVRRFDLPAVVRGGCGAALLCVAIPAPAAVDEWRFGAFLDERAIGEHRFAIERDAGGALQLASEARFDVTLLGLTVYRYRHRSNERWSGDCLQSIDAETDDGGHRTSVRGRSEGRRFVLETQRAEDARTVVPGACLMTFAYWHPALAAQRQLLDPATGRVQAVVVSPLPEQTRSVAGRDTAVRGLRITGLPHAIDVWYAGERWVGLDTTVQGGRRLSYRLR